MRRDEGENERLRALVEGSDIEGLGTRAYSERDNSNVVKLSVGGRIPLLERADRGTRPAGFEPATSASGGQRSIH